jgi:hypothetical protein
MHKRLALVLVLLFGFAPLAIPDKAEKEYSEYTFARVQFNWRNGGGAINGERQPPWQHDYPKSEDFFLTMVSEVTGVYTNPRSFQVVQLDSEDIFRYPFLYFSEPGFMDLTSDEVTNLREYFNRGGFAMFDDFRGYHFQNLLVVMKQVFPDREMFQMELREPVFRAFYDIETLEMMPPYRNIDSGDPTFWGMKDENDRLIVVANADNDFGEFWEDIDNGNQVLQPSVQSFQFGVNYLIYAMTH